MTWLLVDEISSWLGTHVPPNDDSRKTTRESECSWCVNPPLTSSQIQYTSDRSSLWRSASVGTPRSAKELPSQNGGRPFPIVVVALRVAAASGAACRFFPSAQSPQVPLAAPRPAGRTKDNGTWWISTWQGSKPGISQNYGRPPKSLKDIISFRRPPNDFGSLKDIGANAWTESLVFTRPNFWLTMPSWRSLFFTEPFEHSPWYWPFQSFTIQ